MKTEDDYEFKEGDLLFEVGQYFNRQWYILPYKVNKNKCMFSSSKYFKIHSNAREYKKKMLLTN